MDPWVAYWIPYYIQLAGITYDMIYQVMRKVTVAFGGASTSRKVVPYLEDPFASPHFTAVNLVIISRL